MNDLTPQTITELNKAFGANPTGFVVVDEGLPKFAVLDYETFRKLKGQKNERKKSGKILVTGGAGYIGAATVRFLQKAGYEVVVFDNLSAGKRERVRDCELVIGDLGDRVALSKIFREHEFEAVIHFAASIEAEESVTDPAKYFQNNVVNGLNLLESMVEHGVDRMVFSSSAAVYGEAESESLNEDLICRPANPYGETKLMFEKILQSYGEAYGLRSVSLRYFNAAGAWVEEDLGYDHTGQESHLIPRVIKVALGAKPELEVYGQDYPTRDGTCIRDYIHVLDLAEAHRLALQKLEKENGTYVYNVGTGRGYSVTEIIDETMEVTGRMIPMKFGPRRPGDPAKVVADPAKIQKDFGFAAKHGLKSILESSWTWQGRK